MGADFLYRFKEGHKAKSAKLINLCFPLVCSDSEFVVGKLGLFGKIEFVVCLTKFVKGVNCWNCAKFCITRPEKDDKWVEISLWVDELWVNLLPDNEAIM